MSVGDVFISYAHEDSAYKESLVLYLWEHGIAVWADELIVRGEEFPDQLEDQIRRAGAFVVLMSEPSSASAWVQREIRCALGAGVPVFPLLRAGAPFPTIEADYRYDDVRDGNLPSEDWVEDLRDALRPQGSARLAGPLEGVPRPDRVVGRGAAVRDLVAGIREDDGGGNVIDVVGFAGVGKTALARVAAEVVRPLFPCVAWVNANDRAEPDPLSTLGPDRCLVVVDDVGRRRPDGVPPDDGALDRLRSAPGPHIVICIGRQALAPPPASVPYRLVRLRALDPGEAERLVVSWAADLPASDVRAVVAYYGGNPLALREGVRQLRTSETPDQITSPPSELVEIIREDLEALDAPHRAVLEVLALARQAQSVGEIEAVLTPSRDSGAAAPRVELLEEAGWVDRRPGPRFAMVPALTAVVAGAVVERMARELDQNDLSTIGQRPLVRAWSPEATRLAQREAHVRPLLAGLGNPASRLRGTLAEVGTRADLGPYAVGNLLNLASETLGELEGLDLSGQAVREADLTELPLRSVTLRSARFDNVRFRMAFEGIICLALDGIGEHVAAGAADGSIHLFSVAEGRVLATYRGHDDLITALGFAANGRLLASASDDGSVRLWDVRDGAGLTTRRDGSRGLYALAIDPGGEVVAAGGGAGDVRVWDRRRDGLWWRFEAGSQVESVAVHLGRHLVAAGTKAGVAMVWDVGTGERLLTTDRHGGGVNGLSFNPEGDAVIASSSDGRTARRWPVDGSPAAPLPGDLATGGLALSADGRLAASCADGRTVEVWDVATGARRVALRNPDLRFQLVALDPRHDIVVAAGDTHAIRCWDLATAERRWTGRGHSRWIKAVRLTADGRHLVCCSDTQRIHVWDVGRASLDLELSGHDGHLRDLATHPIDPATLFSASDDRTVAQWDLTRGELVERFPAHDAPVWSVAASSDGSMLASGTLVGSITLWSLHGYRSMSHITRAHDGGVRSLAFDRRSRRLASVGDDGVVKVWSLEDRRLAPSATGHGHTDRIWHVRFVAGEPDLLATASEDETVRVWSSDSGRELARGTAHVGPVWAVAPSADGTLLASGGSDRTLRIWQLPDRVRKIAAAPSDEAHPVVALDEPRVLVGHSGWVRSVAFAADGRVATGSHDGTAAIWDVTTGERTVLPVLRPYEGMDVSGSEGLTDAERTSLRALGARTTVGARSPAR